MEFFLSAKENKEKIKGLKVIRKTISRLNHDYNSQFEKNDRAYFFNLAETLQMQAFDLKNIIANGGEWPDDNLE